jgi:hypothetical protein
MRRAITLTYAGGPSGYATAVMVYGPETPIDTQKAFAKTYIASHSGSGSGYSCKVEVWSSSTMIKRYVGHYQTNLDTISQN